MTNALHCPCGAPLNTPEADSARMIPTADLGDFLDHLEQAALSSARDSRRDAHEAKALLGCRIMALWVEFFRSLYEWAQCRRLHVREPIHRHLFHVFLPEHPAALPAAHLSGRTQK